MGGGSWAAGCPIPTRVILVNKSSSRTGACCLGRGESAERVQDFLSARINLWHTQSMQVERLKYIIWAADMQRAVEFYAKVFGGAVLKQNEVISEVEICGAVIGIHGGGEGRRTWTGLSFQVPDVIVGAAEIVAAGGQLVREPQPEDGEPPHLAMCVDPEGNEIMLSRKRS